MLRIPFGDHFPNVISGSRIAPNATLVGNVTVDRGSSIWYNAVIRGDLDAIHVGKDCNIQECSVVHTSLHFPISIGDRVSIGHGSIIHGCSIGDNTLIGMGSIILNGATIGDHCLIGAGSLVTQGTVIPSGSLVLGSPAKVKRPLTQEELAALDENYQTYLKLSIQLDETP